MTRRKSGNDLVVAVVKHNGYAPSRMTSNIRTWGCGRPGRHRAHDDRDQWRDIVETATLRGRGMQHDDDDDEYYAQGITIEHRKKHQL